MYCFWLHILRENYNAVHKNGNPVTVCAFFSLLHSQYNSHLMCKEHIHIFQPCFWSCYLSWPVSVGIVCGQYSLQCWCHFQAGWVWWLGPRWSFHLCGHPRSVSTGVAQPSHPPVWQTEAPSTQQVPNRTGIYTGFVTQACVMECWCLKECFQSTGSGG